MKEVTDMEQRVLTNGPIPLGAVSQYLHKVCAT